MTKIGTALIAAILLVMPLPVSAQNCAPYEVAAKNLSDRHGERRILRSMTVEGGLFEVWISDAGTWSAIVVASSGIACMVAHGTNFEIVNAILVPSGMKL